ncbi:monovalent cation/H+ antiporter complex subunit F [Streptomyces aidingensis]|uniref:Multicomponent Na+:H+ antiporter subunit F n=1 Tax=Streptomyces aidingensis TaxID=910347 RepID=A0A1I1G1K2_9ACTN|nr:monovalent cation/H+ antiporter complex subunit F [Streptomyces aidingensis]SFC03183.1 multicomponent Na+:H+ antiporter subunit F [Streptomyces aidingensis]
MSLSMTDAALAVLGLALAATVLRMARGPSAADRVVAVDLAFVIVLGAFALLAVREDDATPLALVLVGTLVGFLTTAALARRAEGGPR